MELNLPQIEEKILKFWKKNKIFEKSLKKTRNGPRFIFYEGPPFANGLPGIHHLLSRAFKDIILRYKTMRGFYVERRAGWDTHGLPTEMEAEKKLGIKTKKEIEELGIEKFIKVCKKSVFTYKKEWEEFTERIGYWLNLKNAYITCSNDYIETLWWILKKIWEKGFLYRDYKVVPYCPRCGTSLSFHEVAQGYKTIKEPAIYVKFKLKTQNSKINTYFLVWTTTPWTLPGNVAIAFNENFNYVKIKTDKEYLILAKERSNSIDIKGEVVGEFKGKDLIGLEYEPLYKNKKCEMANCRCYQTLSAGFVSMNEGTGLVHIAPAFGEDDMEVIKTQNSKFKIQNLPQFPILLTVDEEGKFKPEVKKWAGLFVKEADALIIDDLKKRELLFKEEMYEHEYPFCWRCETPLLYYAKESWFIKMSILKEKLIKNNKKINWIPEYLKEGRFGEWLKEIKDWNLSRERYWGAPLPIWQCQTDKSRISKIKNQNCDNLKVIGSIKELEKLSGKKIKELHRPYIDKITFKCEKCGGKMKRVPEVVDCWFDSGSMPFAQIHFPFLFPQSQIAELKNQNYKNLIKKINFPADFICEGIDQTRGWFYTLLAISTLLDLGPAYKNVISHGIVLDVKGQKMSKSKGNVIWPKDVISRYGADCARLYFYTINPVGEPKRFDFKELEDLSRRFFNTLWNCYLFFETYGIKGSKLKTQNLKLKIKNLSLLDQWIISRLHSLNKKNIENLDKYYVVEAARLFDEFVVDDLSNWYIRRSRKRFSPIKKNSKDFKQASQTLYYLLLSLTKILAPFTPFIAEEIYQRLKSNLKHSVHLEEYPLADKKLINKKLEEKMQTAREIVALALAERAKAKIKVRQPLQKLKIKSQKIKLNKELINLIKEEINVKKIVFDPKISKKVELDIKITPELKKEGIIREVIRQIQDMRKKTGLKPKDKISIRYFCPLDLNKNLIKNKKLILKETQAEDFLYFNPNLKQKEEIDLEKELRIDSQNLWLAIIKIDFRPK